MFYPSDMIFDECYPFGLTFNHPDVSEDNKYLYQGKELQEETEIYDFHARGYDPALGRTWQIDPHSENYLNLSPFSWVANNPILFTDPTGMDIDLGNLYDQDDDGNYIYETMIRAFEAFAVTKVGKEWIASRAQEGFQRDFVFEKGGINIESAGEMSAVVDYNFKVGKEAKESDGIAVTKYNTEGNKLEVNVTFEISSSTAKPTGAFTFMQLSDAVFHETNFHGYHAEERYMMGERDVNKLKTGDHKQSDLFSSPYGEKAYSYYLYLVNKHSTKEMPGYDRYSKHTKHSNATYQYWWGHFMGQFRDK